MKLLALILFLAFSHFSTASEVEPFKIPRSSVVEVKDPRTNLTYPLFIKLPKSYTKNKAAKYPVIYLTDAKYAFQIVSGATRYPMNAGKMEEAIIVAISYSKGSKGASSRIRDYTPSVDKSWKNETGKAKNHASFIEKIVFPFIEKNYRANSSDRTFVGNSLGGLFGAYIILNKTEMFNNYILGSPSIWFDNEVILAMNANSINKQIRVFIAVGELESPEYGYTLHDMVLGAEKFHDKITKNQKVNIKTKLHVIKGANHETAFPTTAIQGLYWLYGRAGSNFLNN